MRSVLCLNPKPTLVHAKLVKICTTRASIARGADGQDDRIERMVNRQKGMLQSACGRAWLGSGIAVWDAEVWS